jgi:hypothetical protein
MALAVAFDPEHARLFATGRTSARCGGAHGRLAVTWQDARFSGSASVAFSQSSMAASAGPFDTSEPRFISAGLRAE